MDDTDFSIDNDLKSLEPETTAPDSTRPDNSEEVEVLYNVDVLRSEEYAQVANSKYGYEFDIPSEMDGSEPNENFSTAEDNSKDGAKNTEQLTIAGGNDTLGNPDFRALLSTDTQQENTLSNHSKGKEYSKYTDVHKELILRDYQQDVAKRSLSGQNDIILLPTGAGKTYVAIKVIIEHLYERRETGKAKVVFFVPTAELAIQQLKKIQDYLPFAWDERSRMIIGEMSMPMEQMIKEVTGDQYVVLVVTPAIIGNYFSVRKTASLSDFSLLIFDEYHHAKKDHPYNELIRRCLEAKSKPPAEDSIPIQLPQLIGMTATIGIGDSSTLEKAEEYIIGMCAKFGLESPPSESKELLDISRAKPEEEYDKVESRRQDRMSNYLQKELMIVLEKEVVRRLGSDLFKKVDESVTVVFPADRYAQTYEHYLVNLSTAVTQLHSVEELQMDVNYCMVALDHLLVYYRAIQLANLLRSEHGLKYLEMMESWPKYQGIQEIWNLFLTNFSELQRLAREEDITDPNSKITALEARLANLFQKEAHAKVIIFVQMRVVAQYLAELLNHLNPTFNAKEFTSTGPSAEDGGMKPQQRFDAREGFEGSKYNILVATSVLEEGIDIQACIMVIRYMYVKDMIAKIQSRGRARHERGVMVAMLDQKLLAQENRNHFKESLMYKALDKIRALPEEEFRKRVAAQLKSLSPKKVPANTWRREAKKSAKISCKFCGLLLGDMNDVRKYGISHFLIMDGTLHEKVKPFPDRAFMRPMDGMVPYGRLLCKGVQVGGNVCGQKVANLMKMDSGFHFGMWHIKGITVDHQPLKKYKDVLDKHNVEIQPIDMDELVEIGPEACFPERLLRDDAASEQ